MSNASAISELFHIRSRFLRSVHLERDFRDPDALDGYVLTEHAAEHLHRIASGFAPDSGHRAWRITGDYGVGKSSLALLLAHLVGGTNRTLRRLTTPSGEVITTKAKLLPVLVTGSRERAVTVVMDALSRAVATFGNGQSERRLIARLRRLARQQPSLPDAEAVAAIEETAQFIRSTGRAQGLLLILDELGKFLEYAATHPDGQDVFFLQQLGESAARSGDAPIVVVGLLHQGFGAYANRLSDEAQREWQKVAGRFEELVFQRPLSETASLVADALGVDVAKLPAGVRRHARDAMTEAVSLGWYGPGAGEDLRSTADRLYPLHPTVLPVLIKLMSRFGQNERSLFSFLMSSEPFGLQAFSQRHVGTTEFYRIHNLYDYARATLGHYLRVQSYRSHWNLLESVVESFSSDDELDSSVLKTIAILNLLDDQGLLATEGALSLSVAQNDDQHRKATVATVSDLQSKRVLYKRGVAGGFCLWPHTSVNIERAYGEAQKANAHVPSIAAVVAREVDTRPIVARRHYIETGNLRHFEVRSVGATSLQETNPELLSAHADGLILIPLCETEFERETALQFATKREMKSAERLLVAVPKPLETLRSMALEAERWRWVAEYTPELAHDKYAAEEVSRQVEASREVLRNRIQSLVGLKTLADSSELQWFYRGRQIAVPSSRQLLSRLSRICDRVYHSAPRVRNELLNRRQLSSAAAAARMRLIERLLKHQSEALLGLDPSKAPPEMSMYLSVLARGRMHVQRASGYAIAEPRPSDDSLNVLPSFKRLSELLEQVPDARVRVSGLKNALGEAPFGVREGVFTLLLAIYVSVHDSEIAVYEDGVFVPNLDGASFMRLVKDPNSFELQQCRITGVRSSVFVQLAHALQLGSRAENVIDVVRSLCSFAAGLPPFSHQSRRLSKVSLDIRSALVSAREPALLLFQDLPAACGFDSFQPDVAANDKVVAAFIETLKEGLDELRFHYSKLLTSIRGQLASSFDETSSSGDVRTHLALASAGIAPNVQEQRLRGFCLRLSDQNLGEVEWIEALSAYVVGKRPADWTDNDSDRFPHELQRLAQLFKRVEAAAFERKATGGNFAARLAVTSHDGSDIARVVHLSPEDEPLAQELEAKLEKLLAEAPRVALAATSRVLMRELSRSVATDAPHVEH